MSDEAPKDVLMKRYRYLAEKEPNREAFVFVGDALERLPLTRYQLWDSCARYASRLRRYGIKNGDVVCSMIKTSRTKLVTSFGIIAAGGVVVNGVTILADGQDIFRILNTAKCQTILTSWNRPEFIFLQQFLKMDKTLPAGIETIIPVQCEKAPCLKQLIVYQLTSHEDHTSFLSSLADEDFYEADVTADDEAYIFLTSGSTSYSKMVPRTHRECLALVDSIPRDDAIVLNNREMEWIGGFPSFYLAVGSTTIVQEYKDTAVKLNVVDVWNFACKEGATAAVLVPAEVVVVKQAFYNGTLTSRIKRVLCGAQPLKKSVFSVVDVICDEIMIVYGSTDAGFVSTGFVTRDNKDTVKDCYAGDKLMSDIQMKIVDEKTKLTITSPNKVGKLFLKGGNVLRHYMNVDYTTSGVFTEDGWFDSSDVGYIDDIGGIHVIGRTSDIIISGPGVLYPQWLEERIQQCPGVASVVVVGIPHPVKFQEICVCVIKEKNSNLTAGDLEEFCNKIFTKIAGNDDGLPKKFFFLDTFPQTSTGKHSRKALEKLASEYFQNLSQ
ncbi:2-succinylbenzoate--CoA ligase-like [Physella acuta]|uniref:2-succinylbenzoate--CoA ligase-like n=1 Tax=Physella acuta TaxID=109671 RepID=UPI0027DD926E|nr:2-succinylbenzoate--CoA ligase-like [Physella acuta]